LIDVQDLDTSNFQILMGQLASQGYIENIRCITFHPIPPIAGYSCFIMDAAPVWFGNPLGQLCLPPCLQDQSTETIQLCLGKNFNKPLNRVHRV